MREPKLATADIGNWTREMVHAELMAELEQEGKCLLVAGPGSPCKMLDEENRCSIYPTRPNVCVALQAGDEQCQASRKAAGLQPLPPQTMKRHVDGQRKPILQMFPRETFRG